MKLLLLGPPSSGKGTIGKMLSEKLNVPLIGAGKLLRNLPKNYPNYEKIDALMDSGGLAPNDVVSEIIKTRLNESDCKDGYVLDGYPRDIEQLKVFDPPIDHAILLKVSIDTIYRRVMGRRICSVDGKIYNIYTLSEDLVDDAKSKSTVKTLAELEALVPCAGKLIKRDDDNEESLQKRLQVYFARTIKVNEHYRGLGSLVEINAEPKPVEIVENIQLFLNTLND